MGKKKTIYIFLLWILDMHINQHYFQTIQYEKQIIYFQIWFKKMHIHCQKFWRRNLFSGSRRLSPSLQLRRPPAETAARWRSRLPIKNLKAQCNSQFYSSFLFSSWWGTPHTIIEGLICGLNMILFIEQVIVVTFYI